MCDGQGLPAPSTDEELVAQCARELVSTGSLSETSFAAVRNCFSERGVVELITAIGFYAMLAYIHNAMQIEPPANRSPAT
jgi:alkylhydroperoxidase family enzyme